MTNETDGRIARTESLFRNVNERIAESAARFGAEETTFVCEYADPACADRVDASLDTYEQVRKDGATFLIAEGHDVDEVEAVVKQRRGYAVVEKVKPAVREIVKRLNPRTA